MAPSDGTGGRTYQRLKSTLLDTLAPHAHRSPPGDRAYRGHLDGVARGELQGWVARADSKGDSNAGGLVGGLVVGLFARDGLLATATADLFRADVRDAGIGDGRCGFAFAIGKSLQDTLARGDGQVHVRVLDGSDHEVGRSVLPRALPGGFDGLEPKLQQCRQLLYGDLDLLRVLIDQAPEAAPDRPPLTPHAGLLATDLALPGDRPDGPRRLPAFLEYTKFRTRAERDFDTEGNPEDREHFLHWYLDWYCASRGGLRAPLTREIIDHLNAPVVMGGQRHVLTRAMWWRLLRTPRMLASLDLGSAPGLLDVLYWWAATEARSLHAEDCLVTARHVEALRVVPLSRQHDAYAFSAFIDRFFGGNPQFHFLDAAQPEDRRLFMLCMAIMAVSRPDLLRYLPGWTLSRLMERPDGQPSMLERFHDSLTQPPPAGRLTEERYAAALRLQGYDVHGQRFLSITPEGDRLEAARRPRPAGPKVDVQLIGPFQKASGLGQATRLSAAILAETRLSTNLVDFGLDNPSPIGFSTGRQVADFRPARVNLIHLNAESIPLAFAYAPDVFSGAYNIGYFYWELDSPATCHYLGMSLLDEIWVSTEFGVSIYRPEAACPVTNVGMSAEAVGPIDRRAARAALDRRFGLSGGEFLFLVTFDSFSFAQRKNPLGVLEAFRRAFADVPGVRLLVKTQNRDNVLDPAQSRIWRRVEAAAEADPRILVLNETLSYPELLDLKAGADAYVSLHRAEGWGFGMIEAMNLGVPVICTAYSGNMDFCSDETAWLVGYTTVQLDPDDYLFVRHGQTWAEPDLAEAAAAMRAAWSDPAARAAKAEAALARVRAEFSTKAIARRYESRLRDILAARPA